MVVLVVMVVVAIVVVVVVVVVVVAVVVVGAAAGVVVVVAVAGASSERDLGGFGVGEVTFYISIGFFPGPSNPSPELSPCPARQKEGLREVGADAVAEALIENKDVGAVGLIQ